MASEIADLRTSALSARGRGEGRGGGRGKGGWRKEDMALDIILDEEHLP